MFLPNNLKLVSNYFSNKEILFSLVMLTTFTAGCAVIGPPPNDKLLQSLASTPQSTKTNADLTSLPEPRGILRAAVYSFRDYTGQYKPQPSNTLSSVVTQGADAILINALLESKWFAPVERATLQNLLTERKILKSSLVDQNVEDPELPSVAPAELMIEGSIVSYDSNTATGGSGLRFLGIGASTAYREDRVTISVRLIDIDNGLILHNVVNTKRIFSRKLDSGIFSYIDSEDILELEAGFSVNEPSHIAITESIEAALINLIAEGVVAGTLQLANAEDIESPVFDRFLTASERQDFLNKIRLAEAKQQEQREKIEAIKQRMRDGIAGLNKYRLAIEREQAQKNRLASLRRANRSEVLNQNPGTEIASKTRNTNSPENSNSSANANVNIVKVTAKTTNSDRQAQPQPVVVSSSEKLIADQSQAILKAQADIQVKATQQAHQAALYAQQLILRREAEIREQRLKQQNPASQPDQRVLNQSQSLDQAN